MMLADQDRDARLAFDDLIEAYEKRVFNLIYRIVGDYDEAADLTQDTFVAAYRAYAGFRGECSVYNWLCRIAVNLCKNRFRDRDRRREWEEEMSSDEVSAIRGSEDSVPDLAAERKELKERVEEAISALPEAYRVVEVLRDLQGMSYQEIAAATELSLDNVKARLSRARAMLRRRLAPYMGGIAP